MYALAIHYFVLTTLIQMHVGPKNDIIVHPDFNERDEEVVNGELKTIWWATVRP